MPDLAPDRIFRQAALDRISSPEQLDGIIILTKPRDWLAALALTAVVALGLVWSVYGTVPVRVIGNGITIATGGRVVDAVAVGDGTLASIDVLVGSVVERGQVVGRVENRDLRQALVSAEAVVRERIAQAEALASQTKSAAAARDASLTARQQALRIRVRDAEERTRILDAEVRREEVMYERRLVTWQILNTTKQALTQSRQDAMDARTSLVQIEDDDVVSRNSAERGLQAARDQVAEAHRQVRSLELQISQRETIAAPIGGRVTEWKAAPGTRLGREQPILSIEGGVTGIEMILYLPPDQGKQVVVGMKVWIAPSTVKREEYGTMIGRVVEMSDFPSTPQAMMSVLQNDRLVQRFAPAGAPFAARVALDRDPTTPSGFAWTSGRGPAITVTSGTVAQGDVTVTSRAPITYVLPWLKKVTGYEG